MPSGSASLRDGLVEGMADRVMGEHIVASGLSMLRRCLKLRAHSIRGE